MLRAIQEIQPRWIVGENVLGLVNWNGGMVFEEVQADLEVQGYEVQPYVLPAAAVNAPHRRDRVWFVAYSKNNRYRRRFSEQCTDGERKLFQAEQEWNQMGSKVKGCSGESFTSDTESKRYQHKHTRYEKFSAQTESGLHGRSSFEYGQCGNWENFPTVSPICDANDGISNRLDSITFSKWRTESIKAGGNAIVPQVVFQIFKAIELFTTQNQ